MRKVGLQHRLQKFEDGKNTNVLTSEVSTLLQIEHIDPDEVIESVIWKEARRYRVSITVCDKYSSDDELRKLFGGYEEVVSGDVGRRKGEVLNISDLRPWMESFSQLVISCIKKKSGY